MTEPILNVSLSRHGDGTASAYVGNSEGDEVCVIEGDTGRGACKEAARLLRDAADRFDKLSQAKDPFLVTAQDKINVAKIPGS